MQIVLLFIKYILYYNGGEYIDIYSYGFGWDYGAWVLIGY